MKHWMQQTLWFMGAAFLILVVFVVLVSR